MFNLKNVSLLILLLFLMAVIRGLFQGPFFQQMFSLDTGVAVVQEEIYPSFSEPENYVEVIIDVSGSMWGQFQGVNKIVNSQAIMEVLLKDLPPKVQLGLRTFGGHKETHLQIPLGTDNRQDIWNTIQLLRPSGKSPIGYALQQAGNDLIAKKGRKYIVLISDGIDTGQIDPVCTAKELKAQGITTHVIFVKGAEKTGEQKLREIAKSAGGRFFTLNEKESVVPTMTLP